MKIFCKYWVFVLWVWVYSLDLKAQCTANFSHDTLRCSGENIVFTPVSQNSGNTYLWDFGDVSSGASNVDTSAVPTHVFSKGGTYTVSLVVTNGTTCSDTFSSTIRIFKAPVANFDWENACEGIATRFLSTSKQDSNDVINQYHWNLGNSSNQTGNPISVTYMQAQSYDVTLRVTSIFGCIDSTTKTVTVYEKPSAQSNVTKICQNSTLRFTADTKTSALSYEFDFGDSSTFTQRVVDHIYTKTGWMKPSLVVTYPGTACNIDLDSILVNPLPDARFEVIGDTQCFTGNNVCIKLKYNASVSVRNVTFDDGYVDQANNPIDSLVCHSYIDPDGGVFKITVELTDTNGCSALEFKEKAVVIHKKLVAGINNNQVASCFGAFAQFQNTTNRDSAALRNVIWIWGDTTANDTVPFTTGSHKYEKDGIFYAKIAVQDTFGCWDSATAIRSIQNTAFPVDAKLDTLIGYCHNNNRLVFSQSVVNNATIIWNFPTEVRNQFSGTWSYNYPGVYVPKVRITKNGCDTSRTFDSVVIYGPVARFGAITNQFQCQIKDTVYFQNATYAFRNEKLSVRWDAQDPNGPNCIAPGSSGQYRYDNCNYSTDSLSFQHLYQKGKEDCYFAKLVVRDTALGCADSTVVALPLMAPVAKGNFTPSDTFACPGPNLPSQNKTVTFDLNKPEPSCLKYAWWVMWDSLQASNSSNFDSFWTPNSVGHNYEPYTKIGDSAGYVTVGLIVENGLDTNGQVCRDTAWFHKIIKVTRVDARFTSTYNDSTHFCKNDTVHFALLDTQQNSGIRFIWNFGDGTVIDTVSQMPLAHPYKNGGSYFVKVTAIHPDGCMMEESMWVHIGVLKDFEVSKTSICLGYDSINLWHKVRYYGWGPSSYLFNDSLRYQQQKEYLLFDLGEGDGFKYYGPNPKVGYKSPGVYQISMVVIDSVGCKDTLNKFVTIQASGVYAGFQTVTDTFLCPQNIQFTDKSSAYDSINGNILTGDYVQFYEYNFGSAYPKSLFPNPSRFFETGNYTITQKVTNQRGCVDSITKNIVVIGPKAAFEFIKDTVGCAPLRVDFKNKSSGANEYSWRFNDVNNNVLTTSSDSNVFLNYQGFGDFYPLLIARGSFTINGITRVCQSVYPDTSLGIIKTVKVFEKPKASVVWSTNCETFQSAFFNVSTMQSGSINHFWCSYGDGNDLGTGFNPSTQNINMVNTYADTGTYDFFARVVGFNGCADTFRAKVKIAPPPKVNFRWNPNCIGEATQFYDSTVSFNDYITSYFWDYQDGSYGFQRNPLKTFGQDKSYFVKLRVQNSAGCFKDTTKEVVVFSRPNVSFSANPVCHLDTTRFIQSTTSKQAMASWKWDFNNGDTSVLWEPKVKYEFPNSYWVKLVVETVNNCKDSMLRWVFVDPNPEARIKLTGDSIQCFTQHRFNLEDISTITSGSTTAQWSFGDATTATTKTMSKRYSDTGTYEIRLISVSNYGCRDTQFKRVEVLPSTVPNFTINTAQQCFRGNEFQFVNTSTLKAGNYDFTWQFGDGATAFNASPVKHSYTDTGIIPVMLRTLTQRGCADTLVENVRLWPMPKANFLINDSDQCVSTNMVSFNNISTIFWGNLSYNWNLGNGSNSTQVHPSLSYADTGRKSVTLIARSAQNCADTISKNLWIREMPRVSFTLNDSSQCSNQNAFIFRSTSKVNEGALNYLWNFGDGNTGNLDTALHQYANDGEPIVTLRATTIHGCIDSAKRQVFVRPMPVPKIWVNDSQQCVNQQNFIFRDTSTVRYGTLQRIWNYKLDSTSNGSPLFLNFPKDTQYVIKLIEESNFGCKDSTIQRITTWPKPFPNFTIAKQMQCLRGNEFSFSQNGSLKSGNMLHQWRFGDGSNVLTGQTSKHSYLLDGNFDVLLTSTSDKGCVDSLAKTVTVWPMPVSNFLIDDSTQCLRGNKVRFTSQSTLKSGSMKHYWDLNDSKKDSSITSIQHEFSTFGTFVVAHWVISNNGCGDTLNKEVQIFPMPVSTFQINDTGQCINQQLYQFTDQSTVAFGNLSRRWEFFDSTSQKAVVSRTFPSDIRYRIQLLQWSDRGCGDTSEQFVTVFPKPNVAFIHSDSAQCLNQNFYKFTNGTTIKYGQLTYTWNIGEFGEVYTTKDADYFYSYAGFKNPHLVAASDLGCVDSLTKTIKVNPMPVPLIGHNDSSQCFKTQNFIFWSKSTISEGSLSHRWHMGDGTTITQDSFRHVYAKDTFYTVKLIETSAHGCIDSTEAGVVARPTPEIEFRINDTLQCLRQNLFETVNYTRIKYGTSSGFWSFGDGNVSTELEPKHTYATHGNYVISLRAISNHGCSDTAYQSVIVGAMPQVQLLVNDPGQCFKNQNFAFLNLSNIAAGTYEGTWHFGDGNTLKTNADQVYQFGKVGDYQLKLVGVSNYGCMDSFSQMLYVNPNPLVSFSINDTDQCINAQNFLFTATSTIERGTISRNDWSLDEGDLNTYNTLQVSKVYGTSGFKSLKLKNRSDSGCIDSTQRIIRVYPKPTAAMMVNDSAQCLFQNDYVFQDVSFDSSGIKRWWWNVHGEKSGNANSIGHVFKTTGVKQISLVVESEWGCFDTSRREVFVKSMPDARFEKLRDFYCEETGDYDLNAFTAGGQFFGKNVWNQRYLPEVLWKDTVSYVVTVNGCTDSSRQFTQVFPQPFIDLGSDTTLCKHEILELSLTSWNSQYRWEDGSTRDTRKVTQAGTYYVTATNQCGTVSDTVYIQYRDDNCRIYIPTAFTPTGDGLNDFYAPVHYNLDELEYQIFNRWGEKVFEGTLVDPGWDGSYLGAPALQGAYVLVVRYKYATSGRAIRGNDRVVFYLLR
jgi:gliding motility-associated-like protein